MVNLKPYLIIDVGRTKIITSKDTESEARALAKSLSMSGGHAYLVSKLVSLHSSERVVNDTAF